MSATTATTVAIPNLGIGNLASVANMIRKCGGTGVIVSEPAGLAEAGKIILAGVGSFDSGAEALRRNGWEESLSELALERKVPVLGICLGMQLMCRDSEEGDALGLAWFDAHVRRLRPPEGMNLKIPHMGWNTVEVLRPNALLDASSEQRFYFVHSYHAVPSQPGDVTAIARHGHEVTAAFSRGNLYGVQFHPEKSHRFGLALIRRFLELPC